MKACPIERDWTWIQAKFFYLKMVRIGWLVLSYQLPFCCSNTPFLFAILAKRVHQCLLWTGHHRERMRSFRGSSHTWRKTNKEWDNMLATVGITCNSRLAIGYGSNCKLIGRQVRNKGLMQSWVLNTLALFKSLLKWKDCLQTAAPYWGTDPSIHTLTSF